MGATATQVYHRLTRVFTEGRGRQIPVFDRLNRRGTTFDIVGQDLDQTCIQLFLFATSAYILLMLVLQIFLVMVRSSAADLPMVAAVGIPTTVSCSATVIHAGIWLWLVLVRTNHHIGRGSVLSGGVPILPRVLVGHHHHPRRHILDHLY